MKNIEPGFYYHFKHDPKLSINNYAYEVMGLGHHTERDCSPEDQLLVIYRPIYEAYVYKNGKMYDVRPLSMFAEDVERDGMRYERFRKITDAGVIAQLTAIRNEMYL